MCPNPGGPFGSLLFFHSNQVNTNPEGENFSSYTTMAFSWAPAALWLIHKLQRIHWRSDNVFSWGRTMLFPIHILIFHCLWQLGLTISHVFSVVLIDLDGLRYVICWRDFVYCFYCVLSFLHSYQAGVWLEGDSSSGFAMKMTFDGCYILGTCCFKESLSLVFQSE